MPLSDHELDLLVARRTHRKVEQIVTKTMKQFRKIIGEYETLSPDEILMIGLSLFANTTVQPLERMATDPTEMRKEMANQIVSLLLSTDHAVDTSSDDSFGSNN